MKTKQQTGSAHVVIIVILVLAVLGLLGFVFWQNFIQKKDTAVTPTASTSTTQTTDAATIETPKTTQTALLFSAYSVEVPYDSSTDTYTLTSATTGGFAGGFTIHSKKVTDACGDSVNVGVVKRFNKGDSIPSPSNEVTVGNYTYALSVGAYGSCDAGFDTLTSASTAFADAFKNIKVTN